MKHWSGEFEFSTETEFKYGSTVYGMYCVCQKLQTWRLHEFLGGAHVKAHAQKKDLVFQRNGRVHLIWRRGQFSRLLAAEVCALAVVMLDTPCSEVA